MRKPGIIVICVSLLVIGCDSQAAKNRNAQIVANYNKSINQNSRNTNVNANSNSNSAGEDEQVPTFGDANEALKKGDDYLDRNLTKQAIEAYRQATEIEVDLAEAHFKLGVAYSLLETEAEADPNSNTNRDPQKRTKPKKKNSEKAFENAVRAYRKFVRKNPKDHEAHYNLGRAYNKLFDDKEAEKALRRAVKLSPDESLYRTELGAVLIKLAKYPAAIKELDKAIELDKDNFRAEDLLVEARAGRKRTGYKSKKK